MMAATTTTAAAVPAKVLESTDSIISVMATPLYAKGILTNTILTFVANAFITKSINENKPENWVIFGDETINGLIFFFCLVPTLFTAMRGELHKAIIEGAVRPLSSETLANNVFTGKGLLYCCSIPRGWLRWAFFIFNGALFPGILVAGLLMMMCQTFGDQTSRTCAIPFLPFVLLDALWKAFSVAILYTMHFIACHNENEPEIIEARKSQAATTQVEDKKTK